jgi:hypothetical protein
MLYGNLTSILPILRNGYPTLAVQPLNSKKSFFTASLLWVNNYQVLHEFNNFLLRLGTNQNNEWMKYLQWLSYFACCTPGGIPDGTGKHLRPFAVNEMSIMSYYHELKPLELRLFPIVPEGYKSTLSRHATNISDYAPGGNELM